MVVAILILLLIVLLMLVLLAVISGARVPVGSSMTEEGLM